jgi:hypothetical protein
MDVGFCFSSKTWIPNLISESESTMSSFFSQLKYKFLFFLMRSKNSFSLLKWKYNSSVYIKVKELISIYYQVKVKSIPHLVILMCKY